jgi:hypothetical protein
MIPLLWTAGTLCGLFLARKADEDFTSFQCHHCGETFYAPSEEEMETMMENHLYESHREEWEKLPRF